MADPWAVVSRVPAPPPQGATDDPWSVVERKPIEQRTLVDRFKQNVEDAFKRSPLNAGLRGRAMGVRNLGEDTLGLGLSDALTAIGPEQPGTQPSAGSQRAAAQEERARREAYDQQSNADPWFAAPGGLPGKAAAGLATLGGQVVGALGDPLSYINPGSTIVRRAGAQAGIAATGDTLAQGADVNTGAQDRYSPGQTAAAAGVGATISVGGDALVAGSRALGRAVESADPWGVVKRETARAVDTMTKAAGDGWQVVRRSRASAQPKAGGVATLTEAQARQVVSEVLPGAIITSGRRSRTKNKAVGGAERSYHLSGQALDMVPPKGVSIQDFRARLEARGIDVAELLDEGDHWHLAWRGPAREAAAREVAQAPPLPPELANTPDLPFDQIPDADTQFRDQYARTREGEAPISSVIAPARESKPLATGTRADGLGRLTREEAAAPVRGEGVLSVPRGPEPGPRVLEAEGLRARLDEAGGDMRRLASEIRSEVSSALDEGRPVTLYADGRTVEIVSARDGALRDAQGQPWGIQPLLQPAPGRASRLEIGAPAQGLEPATTARPLNGAATPPQPFAMAPGGGPVRLALRPGEQRATIDLSAYGEPPQASRQIGGLREAPRPGDVPVDQRERFAGQTISQLSQRLRQALGITHRQGRMTLKGGAVGQYDPANAVIRTKAVQELDVLAHEAAHALEFQGGPAMRAALAAHDVELRKLAYPGANPAHVREEGFAEFGRWYLTNPDHARKMAPNFYDAFERALAADNPKASGEFRAIQQAYQDFLSAPSLKTAAASVALTGNPGLVQRAKEALRDRGVGGALKDLADAGYTAFVDDLNPINKAVRKLQEIYAANTGQSLELNVAKNPYALARLSRESYAAGYVDLMQGVVPYRGVDPSGPSLSQALEHALGARTFRKWSEQQLREFDAYLIARRMVHEWDRYTNGDLPRPPDRNTKEYHQGIIRDAEAAHPTWAEAAEMIYGWLNNLWKKEFDAGLITQESYQNGLTKHPDYVPLMRDMSDKAPGGSGRPRGALQFAGGTKAFEGSTRDVISPTSSMMRRAYELNAIIKRNDAIRALDEIAEAAGPGAGAIVERLPPQEIDAVNVDAIDALTKAAEAAGLSERDVTTLVQAADAALDGETAATVFRAREFSPRKGESVVFAWRGGKKQPLLLADGQFGRDLYTALTGMNQDLQNVVVDAMAAGTQLLRYGVTLSPEFMSRNYVRDQVATWINSDVGFVPVLDSVRGAAAELKQGELATRYAVAGGMRGGANVAATRKPFPKSNREAMEQLRTLQAKGQRIKRFASWRGLAELTDLSETSTRLGVFKRGYEQARKRGLSEFDATLEAAFASRDYLDFGRRGAKMLSAVRLVTFLNASLQSLDKTVRVLTADGNLQKVLAPLGKNAPKTAAERRALAHAYKAWAKVSALGAFGLGLRMLYADDPEYQEISDSLRATHWVAKIEGRWAFIPKPFELATLSNIFERAYEAGALNDPTAPRRLLSDFAHTIAPPHEIPAISVPFAIAANRDYQGRPIVPDHLRGTVDPHLQFNSYTSEFSKALGRAINVSPAVIDYVITGFGGSLGRYFQQGTNMAVEAATGVPRMSSGPEDAFLSRGFVRNITRGSASQKEFWGLVSRTGGQLTRAEGTFRRYLTDGNDAEAARYLASMRPSERGYVVAKVFSQDGSSILHPLVRAQKAVSVIGDLRQANRDGELRTMAGDVVALSPQQRRQVDDALAHLAMVQMRNALISAGQPGWGQKQALDENEPWKRLDRASREAAQAAWDSFSVQRVPVGPQADALERQWQTMRPMFEARPDPSALSEAMANKRLRSTDRMSRLREAQRLNQEEDGQTVSPLSAAPASANALALGRSPSSNALLASFTGSSGPTRNALAGSFSARA